MLFTLFLLKMKNTILYRHNFVLLVALPVIAAVCAFTLLTFYIDGGAVIPVGVIDHDVTDYSNAVIERFKSNESISVNPLATNSIDDAVRMIQSGRLEAVVVVRSGFADDLRRGEPESVYEVICQESGIVRGLVTELFAAEVSRIYFGCDSANRVLRDKLASLRRARQPTPTAAEQSKIWNDAFRYYDAYWEPEPLMTIDYDKYPKLPGTGALELASADTGIGNVRDLLNTLIAKAVFALFFTYAAFCVINASQSLVMERSDGVIARLRAGGLSPPVWIFVSGAVPFLLYGIPATVLLCFLTGDITKTLFSFFGLAILSGAGAAFAFAAGTTTRHRVFTAVFAAISFAVTLPF